MKGTVWQRCTSCRRKVNGTDARRRHRDSGCAGTNATWAYKTDVGSKADGSRRQRVRAGFATQADAERALRETLSKHDRGEHVPDAGLTVRQFLTVEWLPAIRPKVAATTYAKRRLAVRYVVERIGDLPLQRVSTGDLERVYADLLASGGRGGRALSPATVRDTHRVLHKAYVDAQRWQLVSRNPAAAAEAPKLSTIDADARAARQVWTGAELGTFLDATADHRMHAVFALAAYTGARRSELLALTWDDVDVEASTLAIGKAYVQQDDGSHAVRAATKSTASARTVSLDATTVALLRRHRAAQATQRLAAGSAWHDGGALLTDELGRYWSPPAVSQAFRRAQRTLDLPYLRFHDLRHTHATLLLQAGVPVRTVSQRLGHRSAVVTMTIYSHVLPGDDQQAADQFEALVERGGRL